MPRPVRPAIPLRDYRPPWPVAPRSSPAPSTLPLRPCPPPRSLENIPEDITCELFVRVLQLGRLTPVVLRVFKETRHPVLLDYLARHGITDDLPPRTHSSEHRWLGF